MFKTQLFTIEPGKQYMLDDQIVVTVLKVINRAKTSFSVEIPGRGIDTVDISRLKPLVAA